MLSWNAIASSPSKSFAAGAIAFCVGVALATFVVPADQAVRMLEIWTGLFALTAGVAVVVSGRSVRVFALSVLLLVTGAYRATQDVIPPDTTAAAFVGSERFVSGTVAVEPSKRGMDTRVVLDQLEIDSLPVSARLQTTIPVTAFYGDRVSFRCALELPEPFDGFDYPAYLRSKDIYALCTNPSDLDVQSDPTPGMTARLLTIKSALVQQLGMILAEPQATFVSGLIFGGDAGLSDALQDAFKRTGTSHILAASGSNVSLFSATLFAWLALALGRRRASVLSIALVTCYVIIAGASAAVVRAGIMAGLVLVGAFVRRKPSSMNLFLAAGAVMLFGDPHLLVDVGFQLSFVAMVAIGAVTPRIESWFSFVPETLGLRTSFVGSLSASVLTIPILLWHFGTLSIVSPFTNFLILPLVPWIMTVALAALALSFADVTLGLLLALPAWALSSVLLHIVSWEAALSFASVSAPFAHALALLAVAALLVSSYFLWRSSPHATRRAAP